MTAHEAYGKKIARGEIAQNIWEKAEVDIRVILKCQFAAFYSLVDCEFFRQTETP